MICPAAKWEPSGAGRRDPSTVHYLWANPLYEFEHDDEGRYNTTTEWFQQIGRPYSKAWESRCGRLVFYWIGSVMTTMFERFMEKEYAAIPLMWLSFYTLIPLQV